jgi:IS30 family transposase
MPTAETLAQLAFSGMSVRKIAAQYGATPSQIQRLLKRCGIKTSARNGKTAKPKREPVVGGAPSAEAFRFANPFGLGA